MFKKVASGWWLVARGEKHANARAHFLTSHQPPATSRYSSRSGVTLLEILVVMLILLMITAASVPLVAPAMRNRQMREASRSISGYFGAARARAIETGRPVGVVFERFNGLPFSVQLAQVEVPPPYSGETFDTQAVVRPGALSISAGLRLTGLFPTGYDHVPFRATVGSPAVFNPQVVRVGDRIQFNHRGPFYVILGPDANTDGVIDNPPTPPPPPEVTHLEIAYVYPAGTLPPEFPWNSPVAPPSPVSYQILRQPRRSSTPPLQLPDGVVVDLTASGVGGGTFNTQTYSGMVGDPVPEPWVPFDPVIMFTAGGRVDTVTQPPLGSPQRVSEPTFFLVGRRELMFDAAQRMQPQDIVNQNLTPLPDAATPAAMIPPQQHFWLVVGAQTGQVTVAELAPAMQNHTDTGLTQSSLRDAAIFQSRAFARDSQSVGGR